MITTIAEAAVEAAALAWQDFEKVLNLAPSDEQSRLGDTSSTGPQKPRQRRYSMRAAFTELTRRSSYDH